MQANAVVSAILFKLPPADKDAYPTCPLHHVCCIITFITVCYTLVCCQVLSVVPTFRIQAVAEEKGHLVCTDMQAC